MLFPLIQAKVKSVQSMLCIPKKSYNNDDDDDDNTPCAVIIRILLGEMTNNPKEFFWKIWKLNRTSSLSDFFMWLLVRNWYEFNYQMFWKCNFCFLSKQRLVYFIHQDTRLLSFIALGWLSLLLLGVTCLLAFHCPHPGRHLSSFPSFMCSPGVTSQMHTFCAALQFCVALHCFILVNPTFLCSFQGWSYPRMHREQQQKGKWLTSCLFQGLANFSFSLPNILS